MKDLAQITARLAETAPKNSGTASQAQSLEDAQSNNTGQSLQIATWLAAKTPADIDKAAVSRAQSHGVDLAVKFEGRYPTGANGEYLPSYQVATSCAINATDPQRKGALADLVKFMTPAPVRSIENWLAELSVITAGRGKEGFDAELLLNAYSARLSEYPADVVRYALLKQSWKWFPTWAELEAVCKSKSGPRKHMIAALSKPAPDAAPERRPATQDEKDRIAALIAEQFPNVPQAWRDRAAEDATKGDCMADQPESATQRHTQGETE